jgi:hypothetical protein
MTKSSLRPSAALAALLAIQSAHAANLTWDTTSAADATITNGNATWTAGAGNWNNGATSVGVNFATGDTVTFGSGGNLATNHTVTLGGATTTVGSINANYTGNLSYTIGATANTQAIAFTGGNGSINVTGAPLNGINFNAVVVGNFTVTGSGNRGVVLWGNGNQTTANTITVSPSTLLQAGANSSTGSFGSAAIVNNGVVTYRRSGTLNMTNAISGNGSVNYQLRQATVNLNTAGTYSGNTSIAPTAAGATASTVNWGVTNALPATTAFTFNPNTGSSITLDLKGFNQTVASLAGTGTVSDSIVTSSIGTPTLTISGTTNTSFGGLLSGSLALTKNNTGNLTLNGVSTYTGDTTISGGSLTLGASGSFGNSTVITVGSTGSTGTVLDLTAKSSFGFGSGQTVKGIGTINIGSGKTVTIAGILAPGNSIGTNTITGDLALTGTLQSELGTSAATAPAGVSDRTVVSGNLTLTGSTLQLIDNAGANSNGSAGAGAYRLATYGGTLTGNFSTITNPLSATLHEKVVYGPASGGGAVDLNLYRLATGSTSSTLGLGNTRVGGTLSGNISVINSATADGFSEILNASAGSNTGNVTSSGSFTGLAAGSSNTIGASLSTASAGAKSGTATVSYNSDGAGTSGYGTTANGSQVVTVSGGVYNAAVAGTIADGNLGKTRVGTAFTSSALSISNTAPSGSFTEGLNATQGATTGVASISGTDISNLAGGSSSTSILVGLTDVATSGVKSGTVSIGLASSGSNSSLSDLSLGSQTINVSGTVYDLATQTFTKASGDGSFSGLTLDFGTVSLGTTYTATFDLANASGAFRDSLGGSYTYSGSGSISSTAATFSNLAAGTSNTFTISFNAASAGTYTGTLSFSGLSQQMGLLDVGLLPQDIAITVTAIPEPSTYAALVGVGMIGFALYRRRHLRKAA